MGVYSAAFVVTLVLFPISNVLGATTPATTSTTEASTTTAAPTTTESTAAQTGSRQSQATEVEAKPCPDGVYESAAGIAKFELTEPQCDVIIQIGKPPKKPKMEKKGAPSQQVNGHPNNDSLLTTPLVADPKQDNPKKPKKEKGGKKEKGPKKPKKGGKKEKTKKPKPVRVKRRGKKPEKGKGNEVKVVSRATGEEGASECPQAITVPVGKRGFIVNVGNCELIAIGRKKKKGSKETPAPVIFSRPMEA